MKKVYKIIALVFMMFTSTLLWADAAEKYDTPRTPNSGGVTTGGGGAAANDPRYNLPSASNDDNYFPKKRPSASAVAKVLRLGNAVSLGQAVAEVVGQGIDYILDPANNRVVINNTQGNYCHSEFKVCVNSLAEAETQFVHQYNSRGNDPIKNNDVKCRFDNPRYSDSMICLWRLPGESEYGRQTFYYPKTKPKSQDLEQVAEKIIENADKGHAPSIAIANEALGKPAQNPANPKTKPNPYELPNSNPDSNTSPRPNPQSEPVNPDRNPDGNPDGNPDRNPDRNPDGNPDGNPDRNPDGNPDRNPDRNPDGNPDGNPDRNPDGNPDRNPDGNPDRNPDGNPDRNPDGSPDRNPDGNPDRNPDGNPKSENKPFEFPAFCDWARPVCDFINWFKKDPELKDEQLEIKEQEITQYQHVNHVQFGRDCPFIPTEYSLNLGVGSLDFTSDLTFICDFGHQARWTIIGVGYLLSLIFLIRGLRGT